MNIDQIAEAAMLRGVACAVIQGRQVSAALRIGKGGKRIMWSLDGKRIALVVLRHALSGAAQPQQTLFDLPALLGPDGSPGGSPLSTLVRVPAVFVSSLNAAYAQYMRESEESITFADFLGLVLVAGLEGFGDAEEVAS